MTSGEELMNELQGLVSEFRSLAETAKGLGEAEAAHYLDEARMVLVRAIEQMDCHLWSHRN